MYPREVPGSPGSPPQASARPGPSKGHSAHVCLAMVRDYQLAHAVVAGIRSRLAEAGEDVPVLLAPMYGDEFAAPGAAWRLRAWWDTQVTGVQLSDAALLLVGVEEAELAGLGRVAYMAVPPGPRRARSLPSTTR
ncbi:hypothetical protein [Streptomyces diacarni]|nr:hypothetical protein [Streptomyces diacarni]